MQHLHSHIFFCSKNNYQANEGIFLSALIGSTIEKKNNIVLFSSFSRRQGITWISPFIYKTQKDAVDAAKDKAWEWFIYEKKEPCILVKISTWEILAVNSQASKNFLNQFRLAISQNLLLKSAALKAEIGDKIELGNCKLVVQKVGINSLLCETKN